MSYNGHSGSHRAHLLQHYLLDVLLIGIAFYLATFLRLAEEGDFSLYLPSVACGAFAFASTSYIFGLYSSSELESRFPFRLLCLLVSLVVATILMAIVFYVSFSTRVGRGVMILGWLIALAFLIPHHLVLHKKLLRRRDRVAFVLLDAADESELEFLHELKMDRVVLEGVITGSDYVPRGNYQVLGTLDDLDATLKKHRLDLLVCSGSKVGASQTQNVFRQLRYSGFPVLPVVTFCEEVYKFVPLELASPEWLFHASVQPHSFYIRKLKRAFDVVGSLVALFLLSPLLIAGIIMVRATSPGPIIYRQVRCGKRGRPFNVLKLRTMRVDAEVNGAAWSSGHGDPRHTPVGGFLRKYRIDEIPQFFNVLSGEMSFVGPRPERPEFVDIISRELPLFPERMMVPPGITGWAQVNYPYGASIIDAGHKLEHDLYYMKHMSLFLDLLILLDTVGLILRGGLGSTDMARRQWLEVSRSYSEKVRSTELTGV